MKESNRMKMKVNSYIYMISLLLISCNNTKENYPNFQEKFDSFSFIANHVQNYDSDYYIRLE